MKRIITFALCLCLCLSLCASLAACGNKAHSNDPNAKEHKYLPQWSTNASYHWHDCEDKTCTIQIDKAEHTWGEATKVKDPSPSADGELKKVCTVCERSEVEYVPFESYSAEDWAKFAAKSAFDNFTLYESISSDFENDYPSRTDVGNYYFTKTDVAYDKYTVKDSVQGESEVKTLTGSDADTLRAEYVDFISAIVTLGEKCTYVQISRNFTSSEALDLTYNGRTVSILDLKIAIDGNNVSEVSFNLRGDSGNILSYVWKFSDFTSTTIPQ